MSDLSLLHRQLAHWQEHGEIPMSNGNEHIVSENPYSVTLRRSSVKAGPRMVQAESMLEYDFFCVLDFDPRVEKYKEQPVSIPWRTPEGQHRRYTPDVLVKFLPFEGSAEHQRLKSAIYEIKPYAKLVEDWPKLRPKYRGVQKSLDGTHVPFKVVTEKRLRPAFVKNVHFLLDYDARHLYHGTHLSNEQADRMRAISAQIRLGVPTTPRRMLDNITKDAFTQALHVPWIWHLLRTGNLQADLIEPLTVDTEIWPSFIKHPRAKWMTKEYDWYC